MQTGMQPYDGANENFLQCKCPSCGCKCKCICFVMHGFAPTWICRCKCNQMMVQMKISYFVNVFQEDAYANVMHVMQMFELILMEVQKFIAAFLFKNRLSCLTLNFSDHHQEFFRVRSIWYFEKVQLNELGSISENFTI